MKRTILGFLAAGLLVAAMPIYAAECISDDPDCEENPPTAVPEPGTLALLGLGIAGLLLSRRREP